jgi:hypothetical protein
MLNTTLAKALLGVGALGVVGGTTALAAGPVAGTQNPAPKAKHHHLPVAGGTIVAVSDTSLTIERLRRDKRDKTATSVKEEITFLLNKDTRIYTWSSKNPVGTAAMKKGERVRVAYTTESTDPKAPAKDTDPKIAKRVVILPDVRAGILVSEDADGHSFIIKTKHGDLHVTTNGDTKFFEGRKGKAAGSLAGMKDGQRVIVVGEDDTKGTFDAARVRYWTPDHSTDKSQAPRASATS